MSLPSNGSGGWIVLAGAGLICVAVMAAWPGDPAAARMRVPGSPETLHASAGGQPQQAPRVQVSTRDGHVLGRGDAPLTLVEFTDFQCGFCARFDAQTLPQIKRKYVDSGRLRIVTRDLPLPMHPDAVQAANAARCAGEQGKYWELRPVLFANPRRLDRESLLGYARDLELQMTAFEACLSSDRYRGVVQRDLSDAMALGISGTPTFVLGRTEGNRVDGVLIVGAYPFEVFDAQIQAALSED